jgi:hypothetical protein
MGNQRVIAYCFELEEARTEQKPQRTSHEVCEAIVDGSGRSLGSYFYSLRFLRHFAALHHTSNLSDRHLDI